MSDAARQRMTADEFLTWCLDQEDTFELVDGYPVLKFDNGPQMMVGGTRAHARVASNLIISLGKRLAGGPCYPVGGDLAVRMVRGNIRRPDVTVECGRGVGSDLAATEPKVLIEVLSHSTRRFDLLRKTDEYQRVATAAHIVLLEPDQPRAFVWSRDAEGLWTPDQVVGLEAALALPGIGVSVPLAEVYEGVDLGPAG